MTVMLITRIWLRCYYKSCDTTFL